MIERNSFLFFFAVEIHLQEALTDETCMNCSIMPWSVRLARLPQLDPLTSLPSFQTALSTEAPAQKRSGTPCRACVPAKRSKAALRDKLSSKVDPWAADMEQMRKLLMNIQPAGAAPPPVVVPTQGSPGHSVCVTSSFFFKSWFLLLAHFSVDPLSPSMRTC